MEKSPEEEIADLKQQMANLSNAFVSLSSSTIRDIDQTSRIDALKAIVAHLATHKGFGGDKFQEIFSEIFVLCKDKNLQRLEDRDPTLAALVDDREVKDVPTIREFPG